MVLVVPWDLGEMDVFRVVSWPRELKANGSIKKTKTNTWPETLHSES